MAEKASLDRRIQCPCCGIRTWALDYLAFMRDHDRRDGRVCRAAQRHVSGVFLCPG